jgi:hypothetical protein
MRKSAQVAIGSKKEVEGTNLSIVWVFGLDEQLGGAASAPSAQG